MKRPENPQGWYKDAIIYQLHVKAFYDSTGDGIGDFPGLTQRLDYLQDLGVDTLWLLPFYPSPLQDDGYDIADYRGIHPLYGSMRDFRRFVREAHARGLRIVTELVVNHTSDQHPWFQRARRAPRGSAYRNFYVWSDDDTKYSGTRIIFTDTETSNWAWDPLAKQYYWHRFFSHQPDLNFDNPRVFEAIANVMRFWFDAGVDGLRLDAVPYLCERDGTNNENLPETHDVIKRLRAIVDREYPDRFLLAEANQWPEDVRDYFGDGDECHMAFHFPLMPRMFMAIASEDRYPIHDIMRQTPPIPESSQWAIFLRNHDEMTLEMVSDRERAFMYSVYASDPRARVNVGIRRRLAPLMENDRRKIELMTALLFSMPGTPIVYYGDEIGMGDNIYLGDRDGVRTPMQWSIDRNGGFSRADAQRLYLPIIQDPIYGYQAVNVEAQARSNSSLLNWVKRMIHVRQTHKVFGRGSITFLYPQNRKVLAYLREYEDTTVLCVANLASTPQSVHLELGQYAGRTPIEMLGWSDFPPISPTGYSLSMPRYAFYWFVLSSESVQRAESTAIMPEFFTLVLPHGPRSLMREPARATLERDVLGTYLRTRRWFGAKDTPVIGARLKDALPLGPEMDAPSLLLAHVDLENRASETYQLVPGIAFEHAGEYDQVAASNAFARARTGPREALIYDASLNDGFWRSLATHMMLGTRLHGAGGTAAAQATPRFAELCGGEPREVRRVQAEQSNSSAILDGHVMLKLYRRLQSGLHPEIEMGRYLSRNGFHNTPALLGSLEYTAGDGTPTALAVAHEYVENQGDGWTVSVDFLKRAFEQRRTIRVHGEEEAPHPEEPDDLIDTYERGARVLGTRLGEMHVVLAQPTDDPAFAPEPVTQAELDMIGHAIRMRAADAFDALTAAIPSLEASKDEAQAFLAVREHMLERIDELTAASRPAIKTRIHGDFHLGQVLVTADDVLIVDLEGETQAPFEERRRKQPQIRDVAGMLRSFDYARVASLLAIGPDRAEDARAVEERMAQWEARAVHAFLNAYESTSGTAIDRNLLDLYVVEKAVYELTYELANRPSWLRIPIRGLMHMIDGRTA